MSNNENIIESRRTGSEAEALQTLANMLYNGAIAEDEILHNLPVFMTRPNLSSLLFVSELYKQIINVHGVAMEFGVRWGRNMALMNSLRGMFEPYNLSRHLIGFDTFDGFPSVHLADGKGEHIQEGAYSVSENYEDILMKILDAQAEFNAVSHIKRHHLVKGDVCKTLPAYLEEHPETVVAFAYFDMDIYEPTKTALELILPRMPKGAIIGFDEVCFAQFPGETVALQEVLGISSLRLQRLPYAPYQSFAVIE